MAQAVQMQRKNDSGVYENYYPDTVMSQVEGGIAMKAKVVAITGVANQTITISGDISQTVTTDNDGSAMIYLPYGSYTLTADSKTKSLVIDAIKVYNITFFDVESVLNDNDWATISNVSSAGLASSYWSIGDAKAINLKGVASELSLKVTLYCYILDFDHDKSSASGAADGITFGTFKTAASGGTDVCLVNGYNNNSDFRMNTTNTNSGGWKNSDMRYSILGSTNTQNGDVADTTATSPKANTLMSCLPSDLRAVMRPMYVYTDNTGGGSDTASYVTGTLDYLPLLAEYEVHGAKTYANSAEQNNQTQYAYYKNGNSKVKYVHSNISSAIGWWNRSPDCSHSRYFCRVDDKGFAANYSAYYSYGVAPMFKV
mgnify:FL=1